MAKIIAFPLPASAVPFAPVHTLDDEALVDVASLPTAATALTWGSREIHRWISARTELAQRGDVFPVQSPAPSVAA